MNDAPFKEHGVWQCRGFDVTGKHYNRAFRLKKDAEKFLRAMNNERRCAHVEHY